MISCARKSGHKRSSAEKLANLENSKVSLNWIFHCDRKILREIVISFAISKDSENGYSLEHLRVPLKL